MTLDHDHALTYLHGDRVLLQQLLQMFGATLAQLQHSLNQAQVQGQRDIQHPDWQAFYRVLHGANPTLLIVCAAPVRELVQQVCHALATSDSGSIEQLAASLAEAFVQLAADLQSANAGQPG